MNSSNGISRGMVFGVFDNFHPGHEFFLSAAVQKCNELIVVVTLSEIVLLLKGKLPVHDFNNRMLNIKKFNPELIVVPGDTKLGAWDVLKTYSPDIIFLGYDQQSIAQELEKLNMPYVFLNSYEPNKYKSSLKR
jgi:cytidyltransferase-like protein